MDMLVITRGCIYIYILSQWIVQFSRWHQITVGSLQFLKNQPQRNFWRFVKLPRVNQSNYVIITLNSALNVVRNQLPYHKSNIYIYISLWIHTVCCFRPDSFWLESPIFGWLNPMHWTMSPQFFKWLINKLNLLRSPIYQPYVQYQLPSGKLT